MPSEQDCVDHLVRVSAKPALALQEAIALGLLVASKWDRARAANGPGATSADVASFDDFTATELGSFREEAMQLLLDHAARQARVPDRWSRGFLQGFAASWAYAISVVAALFVVELLGGDLITLLRSVLSHHR
jgi:hypothetical protein